MWGTSLAQAWQSAGEFLSLEKATDLVDKARAAARDVADVANKVSGSMQAEFRRTFVELDCHIFDIRPHLIVVEYPSEEKIDRLATRLNTDFSQRMLIYNMSERKYDRSKLQGEVIDVAFRGLPAPPVELIMELCLSAHHWIASDTNNVLLVHCFQGYSRHTLAFLLCLTRATIWSAIFLSCFMAFQGLCNNPVDALCEVCERLGIDIASAIVPSQRRYLTYFQQCQQGHMPASRRWRLLRVQLNGVPRFESEGTVVFRPYVEVWNHGELVYTSLSRSEYEGGRVELPEGVRSDEQFVCHSRTSP